VLAWRPTSPRRADFEALAQVFRDARAEVARRGMAA
jgi:hypothetical protein